MTNSGSSSLSSRPPMSGSAMQSGPRPVPDLVSKKGEAWRPRDIRTLTGMWRNGSDVKDIARVLGRKENAVKAKLTRLGLPHNIGDVARISAFSSKRTLNAGNIETPEQRQRDRVARWVKGVQPPARVESQSSNSSQISPASTIVDSESGSDLSNATTMIASEPSSPKEAGTMRLNTNAAAFSFNTHISIMPMPNLSITEQVSPAAAVKGYSPQSPIDLPDDVVIPPPPGGRLPSYANSDLMSRRVLSAEDMLVLARIQGKFRPQVSQSAVSLRRCASTARSPKAVAAVALMAGA